MAKCGHCGKEVSSRAKWCSDKCRKRASRTKRSDKSNSDTQLGQDVSGEFVDIPCLPGVLQMTPEGPKSEVPKNYGQPGCECKHCQQTKARREQGKIVINHGSYKTAPELGEREVNRVCLPGDVDYAGVCHVAQEVTV